jgi:outer membrane protein assembly factor BamE
LNCLALLASLGIGACSSGIPGLYRVPIQQGNVVTVQMLQELELGMDKRKVKFVLGTPLVTDAFHQDRWDYYYSYKPGRGDTVQQRAALFFENEQLVRIDAEIDSDIDFRTVTHATDKVLVVPPKKENEFFAAVTPAFVSRDKEERTQKEIARSLDSGYNERPPAAATTSSVESEALLDPALGAPITVGPSLDTAGMPSEIYAPNTGADIDAATTWSAPGGGVTETVSPETARQSSYLEELFGDFGSAPTTETGAAEAQADEEIESQPVVLQRRDPTLPTRD